MSLKDSWKKTGKELGGAFAGLGKNIVRTAKTGVQKAADWADKDDSEAGEPKTPESNVLNDGSWRTTGKDLGHAFADLGKTIVHSAGTGMDKLEDKVED